MGESEVKRGGVRFTRKHEYKLFLISFLTSIRQGASIPTLESTCI